MTNYVVYGISRDRETIQTYVENMLNILKQHSIDLRYDALKDWNTCLVGEKNLFIASIHDEDFHTKVKRFFLDGVPKCMLVLFYSTFEEKHVKQFQTSIKNSLKKKEPELYKVKLKDTLERIVCVNETGNESQWWPHVLKFLVNTGMVKNGKPPREFGVFFKIDLDDDVQMEWVESQRNALETALKVRCRYNDGLIPDETYIQFSQCVVMYVDRNVYQGLESETEKMEGKRRMLQTIRETREICSRHRTMFQIFVNEAGVKLTNTLLVDYGMKMIGSGTMLYWLGLLSLLNLIQVRRVQDTWFYSSKDRNERELFNPGMYPHVFRKKEVTGLQRLATLSSIDVPTLKHAGSEKGVCYQSTGVDDGDNVSRTSVVCCNWLNLLH